MFNERHQQCSLLSQKPDIYVHHTQNYIVIVKIVDKIVQNLKSKGQNNQGSSSAFYLPKISFNCQYCIFFAKYICSVGNVNWEGQNS